MDQLLMLMSIHQIIRKQHSIMLLEVLYLEMVLLIMSMDICGYMMVRHGMMLVRLKDLKETKVFKEVKVFNQLKVL